MTWYTPAISIPRDRTPVAIRIGQFPFRQDRLILLEAKQTLIDSRDLHCILSFTLIASRMDRGDREALVEQIIVNSFTSLTTVYKDNSSSSWH
jgi:hypothetical protein